MQFEFQDKSLTEEEKAEIIAMHMSMLNPTKKLIKDKAELYKNYEILKSNENSIRSVEYYIESILEDYAYGGERIIDFERRDIYKFCLEALCDTARQGGIASKWLLGNQLIKPCTHNKGYLADNMTFGNFLIVLAAHEGHGSACDYMAHRYCDFNFDESITEYWLDKAQKSRWWEETGECLNIQIMQSSEVDALYIYLDN